MCVYLPCRGGGLLTRLTYGRFQELVASGHMHALPTLLPGQWHAGLKAVKSILRRIFIKRDRAWKAYTKVGCWHVDIIAWMLTPCSCSVSSLQLFTRSASWQPTLSKVPLTVHCAAASVWHPAQEVRTQRGKLLA